jgi:arylsulfatase A-like enzyme
MISVIVITFLCVVVPAAAARPNFIILMTDDQDLTLGSLNTMPVVQQEMIQHGMYFNNSFVINPICCPSRTATLSGRYSHNLQDQTLGWCGNYMDIHNSTWIPTLHKAGTSHYLP